MTDSVLLGGDIGVNLASAVAALAGAGLGRFAIIGGVAVTVRLGRVHRATADVDTVVDATVPPDALEALLAADAAEADPTGRPRVSISGTKLEIIHAQPVGSEDLDGISERERLFLVAHAWALDTATDATIGAIRDPSLTSTVPVSTPAALIAMKLHAIQDRRPAGGVDKRGGDAWDIYRLLSDLDRDGAICRAFEEAPDDVRASVRPALERVMVTSANRTQGWLRWGDGAMATVSAAELRHVAAPLLDALAPPG